MVKAGRIFPNRYAYFFLMRFRVLERGQPKAANDGAERREASRRAITV